MPFIVSVPMTNDKRMFFRRSEDGAMIPVVDRSKATRFDEAQADAIAAEHNRYTLDEEAIVEGAKS
jgi:hypothetical protein